MAKHAGPAALPIPEEKLQPIRQRAALARLAGIDAEGGGNGWDETKNRVMRRSAVDVLELLHLIDVAQRGER